MSNTDDEHDPNLHYHSFEQNFSNAAGVPWDFDALLKKKVRSKYTEKQLAEKDAIPEWSVDGKRPEWEASEMPENIPNRTATVEEVANFKKAIEADGIHVDELVNTGQFGVIATMKDHPDVIIRMEAKDARKTEKKGDATKDLSDSDNLAPTPLDHVSTVQTLFRKSYASTNEKDTFHGFVLTAVPRVHNSGLGMLEDFVTTVSSLARDGKVWNWRAVSPGQLSNLKTKDGQLLKAEASLPVQYIHDLSSTVNDATKGALFFATAADQVFAYRQQVDFIQSVRAMQKAHEQVDGAKEKAVYHHVKELEGYQQSYDEKVASLKKRHAKLNPGWEPDAAFNEQFEAAFKEDLVPKADEMLGMMKNISRVYQQSLKSDPPEPMDDDKFLQHLAELFQLEKGSTGPQQELQRRYQTLRKEIKDKLQTVSGDQAEAKVIREGTAQVDLIRDKLFILDPVSDAHRNAELQQTKVLDEMRNELKTANAAGSLHLAPDLLAQLDQKHECEIPPTRQTEAKGSEVGEPDVKKARPFQ